MQGINQNQVKLSLIMTNEQKGEIWLESEGRNIGSTFYFSLSITK